MALSFNTSGPCIPGEHYMLPPERRLGLVQQLIEERKYFTLHAGRQTGKTTSLMWLERHLNASGRWRALWVDLQTAREQPDLAAALPIILENLDRALRLHHAELARPSPLEIEAALREPATALLNYLIRLSALGASDQDCRLRATTSQRSLHPRLRARAPAGSASHPPSQPRYQNASTTR